MKLHPQFLAAMPMAALILGLAGPARADNVSTSIISKMQNPDKYNPGLAMMIGDWKGKGKMRPARRFPKSKVKCRMSSTWIEGGRMIKQAMTCKSFLIKVKRTSYIAFDKATRRYVGMDFGNMGPDNVTFSGTGNGTRFNMTMKHFKPGDPSPKYNKLIIDTKGRSRMKTVMSKVSKRPYEIMNVTYKRVGGTI